MVLQAQIEELYFAIFLQEEASRKAPDNPFHFQSAQRGERPVHGECQSVKDLVELESPLDFVQPFEDGALLVVQRGTLFLTLGVFGFLQ